jgi:hypothetical protein
VVQQAAVPVVQQAGFLPSAPGVQQDAPLPDDLAALAYEEGYELADEIAIGILLMNNCC